LAIHLGDATGELTATERLADGTHVLMVKMSGGASPLNDKGLIMMAVRDDTAAAELAVIRSAVMNIEALLKILVGGD
jgi:hypothetical protein